MAYFSNSSESMDYEARYCDRCQHNPVDPDVPGCAVWLAHVLYNYRDCNDTESVLHVLIPRAKDGLSNEQCRMFLARTDPR